MLMKYFDTFIVRCDNCNFEENAWKSGWYLGEEHSRAPEFNLCPRCYKKNVE